MTQFSSLGALFNRDFSIAVGPLVIQSRLPDPTGRSRPTLRVTFEVMRTASADPNTAKIVLFNLNESNRRALQEAVSRQKGTYYPVIISAGYVNQSSEIFRGDLEDSTTVNEGADWTTTIQANDGARSWKSARMTKSYGPGTTLVQLIGDIVLQFGILPGNILQKLARPPRGPTVFKKGVSVNGRCADLLNKYLFSAGLQWSIQDNQLLVLEAGETAQERIVILNEASGLIGSPEVGEGGVLRAISLLQGSLRPGRRVGVKSAAVDGFYKIEQAVHTGDTWGNEWYTEVEAKPTT